MFWFKEKIFFSCNQCGECCREMDVPLTHFDIARIVDSKTDFDIEMFVTLHPSSEKSLDAILLYGEYQEMYLSNKLSDNTCLFLKENICSIYQHRPNSCRTWPLSKNIKNQLEIDNIAQKLVDLACDKKRFKDHKNISEIINEGIEELKIYRELVKKWNIHVKNNLENQTLEKFYSFFRSLL